MRRLVVALAVSMFTLPLLATPALGHERRTVGQYQFVVGWLTEPAFAGELNGIDLRVTDTTNVNAAVEGLENTLRAEVFFGGLTTPLRLTFHTAEGDPGRYAAGMMPTKAGTYAFRIFGAVGSQKVDERFESGPNRFDDVASLTPLQYPAEVPAGADLNDRIATLQSSLDQLRILVAALFLGVAGLGLATWRLRA